MLALPAQTSERTNHSPSITTPLAPFLATLTAPPQLVANPATLSPFAAPPTGNYKAKSCVCHSYEKHQGVWVFGCARPPFQRRCCLLAYTGTPPKPNRLAGLLHSSGHTPGG